MIRLLLLLVFVCCFSLATVLQNPMQQWHRQGGAQGGVLAALMGDSRRMFAGQFFAKADAYFHSGFYPTIFDKVKVEPSHLEEESHEDPNQDAHEEGFLGPPKDKIESFGRNFFPTVHTHLHGGHEREILPWLKLSADLDPSHVDTYVVAAYWLRTQLNKPAEAEQFLRQGLRANPDSYEILLELGRVYFYNKKDPMVARNLWEMALQKWRKQDEEKEKPEAHVREEILGELVRADEQTKDQKNLLLDLETLKQVSPNPGSIQQYIDDTRARLDKVAH